MKTNQKSFVESILGIFNKTKAQKRPIENSEFMFVYEDGEKSLNVNKQKNLLGIAIASDFILAVRFDKIAVEKTIHKALVDKRFLMSEEEISIVAKNFDRISRMVELSGFEIPNKNGLFISTHLYKGSPAAYKIDSLHIATNEEVASVSDIIFWYKVVGFAH